MLDRYLAARPDLDRERFLADYAGLAALNVARILGIFARLMVRDGKPRYGAFLPRMQADADEEPGGARSSRRSRPGSTPMAGWRRAHDPADDRHGAGRGPGHPHATAHQRPAQGPGRGGGARPDRPHARPAGRRRRRAGRWSTSTTSPTGWRTHLAGRTRPQIVISDERDQLLETGGGLQKARPLLGDGPVMVANIDSVWIEEGRSAVDALVRAWDPARMDVLLLLAPHEPGDGLRLARRLLHEPGWTADLPRRGGCGALRLHGLAHHQAGAGRRGAARAVLAVADLAAARGGRPAPRRGVRRSSGCTSATLPPATPPRRGWPRRWPRYGQACRRCSQTRPLAGSPSRRTGRSWRTWRVGLIAGAGRGPEALADAIVLTPTRRGARVAGRRLRHAPAAGGRCCCRRSGRWATSTKASRRSSPASWRWTCRRRSAPCAAASSWPGWWPSTPGPVRPAARRGRRRWSWPTPWPASSTRLQIEEVEDPSAIEALVEGDLAAALAQVRRVPAHRHGAPGRSGCANSGWWTSPSGGRRCCGRWPRAGRARPPQVPLIAAGSTGTAPATADLLRVIAGGAAGRGGAAGPRPGPGGRRLGRGRRGSIRRAR